MQQDGHVLLRRTGALGHITLDRPAALNALTFGMVAAMLTALRDWASDPDIKAVVVDALPGARAFCAGGDIRALYESGKARDGRAAQFFATEYRLNATIKHFPKPYIALLDGLTMGGGAGISIHGAYRVASEMAQFAMPETAIGLFPDIGASHFLNASPGRIGLYLALTSARISAADMIHARLATDFVPASRLCEIAPRLAAGEEPAAVLASLAAAQPVSELARRRGAIDRSFAAESVEGILAALEKEGEWGEATLAALRRCSPTSLKLTFREMAQGANRDLLSCLAMEYRLALRILDGHDFYEGVRAALIDKDRNPRWRPADLAAVSDSEIAGYFAPLGSAEWSPP